MLLGMLRRSEAESREVALSPGSEEMIALGKTHPCRLRRRCVLFARALRVPAGLNDPDQLLLGPPHPRPRCVL